MDRQSSHPAANVDELVWTAEAFERCEIDRS
jgi:hypothetical protein